MSAFGGGFEVVYDHLPELTEELERLVSEAVRKAAFDIQAHAQAQVKVVTGFLKSSIYTVAKGGTTYTYADASSAAAAINPDAELLPEVEAPSDDTTAYVAVGADYGLYVEMGTSKMAAQPYLIPAAEFVRPVFLARMAELETALKLGGLA